MLGRLVVALVLQRIAAVAGACAGRRRLRMGRSMAWLLGATFVSSAGDWMYRLALPLLVYQMTGSAALTAFTYALEYLPYVVLSPVAGVMADRMDRRRLLIRGDALAALVLTSLVVSLAVGLDDVLLVYATAGLLGIISPFYHPAIQALVPAVVDADDLTLASARLQSVDSVVSLVGPLIGGAVIVALGTHSALLLDAASFAVSALCITAIRTARTAKDPEGPRVRVRAGLAEAAAFIHGDRMILSGAVLFTGANFALFLVQANLVYYLTAVRGFAPSTLGLVFSAEGAGALAGALVAPAVERRWGAGRVILGSTVAAGLLTLPLLWATDPATVSLVCALEAAAGMVTVVTWFSLRLQRVPDKMLGRVVALTRMVAFAAIPAAAVVGGLFLAATSDFAPLILAAAGVQIALGVLGALGPMNQPREAQHARMTTQVSNGSAAPAAGCPTRIEGATTMQAPVDIDDNIAEVRERLLSHPLYSGIHSLEALKMFMSHHVFAVWDFFSLAKRLQQVVTCVEVPWLPPADPTSARLINDIVMSEESDEDGYGGYASHFDLYLDAMRELGADHSAIDGYIARLAGGEDPIDALDRGTLPPGVEQFVRFDMELAMYGKPHEVAAAFCYGREDLIPDMFSELLRPLSGQGLELEGTRIQYYIERHILLDSHEHAPLARRLVALLCGADEERWREASAAANGALEARIALWEGVLQSIQPVAVS